MTRRSSGGRTPERNGDGSGVGLLGELRRRKVLSTAGWYLGAAFVVMQVVEVVFPYAGLPDVAGSAVLAVLVAGFPVAMVVSWLFDVSPPRLSRDGSSGGTGPAPVLRPLRTDSVAVLPFENLGEDPEDLYFSDGVTDDIIASIAQINGLRVVSRSSSNQFRDLTRGLPEIAGALGVATVVTGRVRRSGPRVRVVAELLDARSDDHLWAGTYDRDVEDIFQVQSEIAAGVAQAVRLELSPRERHRIEARGTEDPEAYDLYLRARSSLNRRSGDAFSQSIGYFGRAVERDADFVLAHVGLAEAHALLGIYGLRSPAEAFAGAEAAAEAALTLDPELGEAIAIRGVIQAVRDWSWGEAESSFLRGLELAPSYATGHQWFATNVLTPLGRFDEALARLVEASTLDPASPAIETSHAVVRLYAGEVAEGREALERIVERHPRFAVAHFFLGQCREVQGDGEAALESLRIAADESDESSEVLGALGHALARVGRIGEGEEVLRRLEERGGRTYVSPVLRAQVLAGLGRTDEALDALEEAVTVRAADLIWLAVRPLYEPLRRYPRFQAILAQVGVGGVDGG